MLRRSSFRLRTLREQPGRAHIARLRRLHAENTSFQQLLDEARRELARKYLADARYSVQQVAGLLGFEDDSNFFRACRRWFGVPPGQYRERLASEAAQA